MVEARRVASTVGEGGMNNGRKNAFRAAPESLKYAASGALAILYGRFVSKDIAQVTLLNPHIILMLA